MTQDIGRNGNLLQLVQIMEKRSASFEIDKIAGLAYLTGSDAMPSYICSEGDETAQAEAAWTHLVRTMEGPSPAPMIFLYPAPGDGEYTWIPTWRQLKFLVPVHPVANVLCQCTSCLTLELKAQRAEDYFLHYRLDDR